MLDNDGEREFFLIEFMKDYNGKWDTDQLNQDDYNETTDINFIIENWVFNIHPVTQVGRWINRKNLQRRQSELFTVKQQNNSNGSFSFTQSTNAPAKVRFDNSIIVIRKCTKHLEILYTTTFLSFVPKVQGFKDREAIVEYCRQWHINTEDIIKPDDLNSCPCSLDSARIHPDLVDDFTCSPTETKCHENINARRCFLRKLNNRYVCTISLWLHTLVYIVLKSDLL